MYHPLMIHHPPSQSKKTQSYVARTSLAVYKARSMQGHRTCRLGKGLGFRVTGLGFSLAVRVAGMVFRVNTASCPLRCSSLFTVHAENIGLLVNMSAVCCVCCHMFRFQRFQLPKGVPLFVHGFVCVLRNVTKCLACVVESRHVSWPFCVTYARRVLRVFRLFWVESPGSQSGFVRGEGGGGVGGRERTNL